MGLFCMCGEERGCVCVVCVCCVCVCVFVCVCAHTQCTNLRLLNISHWVCWSRVALSCRRNVDRAEWYTTLWSPVYLQVESTVLTPHWVYNVNSPCMPATVDRVLTPAYSALKMTSHALLQNRHDDVTRTRRHSTPYQCLRPTTVDFRLLVTSWKKENETNRSNSPYSVMFGTACIGLVSFSWWYKQPEINCNSNPTL